MDLGYWVIQTVALLLTAALIPNLRICGPIAAFGAVFVLGLINAYIWDAALFLTIPNSLTYQTLVVILANGVVFWVFAKIMPGIEVKGLISALLAPIVFSAVSLFVESYAKDVDWARLAKNCISAIHEIREELKSQNLKEESKV